MKHIWSPGGVKEPVTMAEKLKAAMMPRPQTVAGGSGQPRPATVLTANANEEGENVPAPLDARAKMSDY